MIMLQAILTEVATDFTSVCKQSGSRFRRNFQYSSKAQLLLERCDICRMSADYIISIFYLAIFKPQEFSKKSRCNLIW